MEVIESFNFVRFYAQSYYSLPKEFSKIKDKQDKINYFSTTTMEKKLEIIKDSIGRSLSEFILLTSMIDGFDFQMEENILLKIAVYFGMYETAKYLVSRGADVTATNNLPIKMCSSHDSNQMARLLLENGADVHVDDEYPLNCAAHRGYINLVKLFCERGANIHSRNNYALRISAKFECCDVARFLLEQGANIHANNDYAFRTACVNKYFYMVKLLIEKGADVKSLKLDELVCIVQKTKSPSLLKLLADNGVDFRSINTYEVGKTCKTKEIIDILDTQGVNISKFAMIRLVKPIKYDSGSDDE